MLNPLRMGDQVAYRGRRYEVYGFTPMSVTPARLLLEDAATGELIRVEPTDRDLVRTDGGAPEDAA